MKKVLFLLVMLAVTALANAQTIVFHENFDPSSNADSVTATGPFALNTRLFYSSPQCDSITVAPGSTSYLETNQFSTLTFTTVLLKFSHICKIELDDTAKIEISVNNGPWVKLTTQYINPGNSSFTSQSYRFCAATYASDWVAGTAVEKPQQSWWKNEIFDISALAAGSSNVKVRFTLKDGVDGDGSQGNRGWYLDDISVVAGTSELFPPVVTMNTPVIQDTVFYTGPFDIYATITDASGIDTAYVIYKLNNGANQYVPMLLVSGNTYKGTIPSYPYNNRIDYRVYAADNSSSHNATYGPNQWFYTKHGPNLVQIGTGTSTQRQPFGYWFGYERSASIYSSSEINMSGVVNNLQWYVATAQTTSCPTKIYLKSTTANTFAAADTWANLIAGATLVYNGTTSFSTVGWKTFVPTASFNYSSGNLMVLCETNFTGGGSTPYAYFQYTSTSGNTHQYFAQDNSAPTGPGTLNINRPNIKLGFPPNNNTQDAGVKQLFTPTGTVIAGVNLPVTLNIKNYAVDSLKKVTIAWKLDGVLQTPYTWTGMLLQDVVSGTLTVGNANVTPGPHTIKAWTELPNDSTDQNHANDTASISFYACNEILNGIYTIGPSGANFPSFAAALTALQNCGISGPVTFNVQSGIYNEQISFPEISGASATNTITFQSLTGNNNDVTVQYVTTTANNYIVKLNGADNFRFKNMTLKAKGKAYNHVIEMLGNAINNQFDGNKIIGKDTTLTSTDNALVYSSAGLDSLSVFNNNTFLYGTYGMYFYGVGSSSLENKTTITNNTFTNQYYSGIYLVYHNAPLISGNTLTTNTTNTGFYGIYAYYCDNNLRILKNKIVIPNSGYGIYIYYSDGVSGKEGLTANNAISIGGTSSSYGIYDYYSSYQNIYYNSVNVYANSSSAYAIYLSGGSSYPNHKFKNNIFAYTGANTSGIAFYAYYPTQVSGSNYNDLFSTGTNLGNWNGTLRANLAAWKTASTRDTNSISVNPGFFSPTDLHTISSEINAHATPLASVTTDIEGNLRNATTPDIGAYEFDLPPYNVGITSVVQPVGGCGLTAAEHIAVKIKNSGLTQVDTTELYYKFNNGTPVHETMIHTIMPDSTYTFTFASTVDMSAPGNYTFKIYLHNIHDLIALDDTINNYNIQNGHNFAIGPYTMGFETTDDMSAWSKLDVNSDGYTWLFPYNTTNSHTGSYCAELYNTSSIAGNEWMFSRCFTMTAATTYKIEFWYRAEGASYPQNVDLKVGNSATPAAMTTNLITLAGFTNTTYQKASATFVPPTSGTYYFGWWGHSPAAYWFAYIDDINISLVPSQEAALLSITEPVTGCGLTTTEPVTIKIKNTGGSTITGNLNASYKIIGGSTITEPVTNTILEGDTLAFTFATPINMAVATHDSTFAIKSWINLVGDLIPSNDSLSASVISSHIPNVPTVVSDTVPYGGIAVLQATSPDILNWYGVPSGGTLLGSGASLTTPNLYATTPYYVEAVTPGGTTSWNFNTDLQGWTVQNPCSSGNNWAWNADAGDGALYASDPTTYSYQLITSPAVFIGGSSNINLSFTHHYGTESCCDEGYVAYKLDNGPWIQFTPTVNTYIGSHSIDNDPLNSCTSNTRDCYYDTQTTPIVSSGNINTSGASNIQLAFVFTSDVSNGGTGWFINNVTVNGGAGGCSSARVPDTAFVVLMPFESSVISMPSPVDQCSNGSENVTIRIRNNGSNTINGNFTAKYSVNGSAPVVEPITNSILPGDTLTYTFATPFLTGLTSANLDSVYHIQAYTELTGDNYYTNDTITKSVTLLYTPPVPVVTNITIPYGTAGTLNAVAVDSVYWYDVPTGGNSIASGHTFITPNLFNMGIYYAESRTGSGIAVSETFDGTSFPANWTADNGSEVVVDINLGNSAGGNPNEAIFDCMDASTSNNTTSRLYYGPINTSGSTSLTLQWDNYLDHYNASYPYSISVQTSTDHINWHNTSWVNSPVTADIGPGLQTVTINTTDVGSSTFYLSFTLTGNAFGCMYWYIDNFSLSSGMGGCASIRVPDTVFVTGVPACDVSVQTIHTPNSGIELTNSEPVSVSVKNYGTSPAVNVPIHYVINGGTVVNDSIPGPIATNDTVLFTFATPANLSAFTTYNFTVYTDESCDATLVNDTAYKTVVNNPLVYCTSAATSTGDCDISNVTVGSINNGNALPVYSNPTCTGTYTDYTSLPPAVLLAGMSYPISVSQCNTSTTFWGSLVNVYIDYNRNGVFDLPGEKVYSAPTSSAATTVSGSFTIPTTGIVTNIPTRMRVVLDESDVAPACGTYTWGETEDYLVILLPQIPHDAGVTAFIQPATPQNESASVPVQVTVKNFGLDTISNSSNMTVAYSYAGGAPQSIIWAGGNIAPLSTGSVTLPNITILPNDQSLCAWTVLAGDSNTFNDTTCMTLHGTPQFDAGIIAFLQPGTSLIEGETDSVRVTLKNFGVDTLTSLNLVYMVNGVLQATQPWTGTLLPNATTNITFTQTFVVPTASFSICAYSSLVADANHANDTICMNSYGVFTSTLPFYDNFDGATVNWTAGPASAGTVWELGTPNYGATNSAHSAPNAWDVNLTSAYTTSATTYLYTQNFDFSTAVNAKMKFWLNYNAESGYDGVRIDYTIDAGVTWNVLGTLNDPKGVNWYNDDAISSSSKPGWTGTSTGWKYHEYKLDTLDGIPLVRFRFVFTSDGLYNYDGASVDDFAITIPYPVDGGVEAIHKPLIQAAAGTLTTVRVRIKNFGSDTLYSIPVSYRVGLTGTPVTQAWTGTLYPEDTATVNFTTAFTMPVGAFDLYSYTSLVADGDHFNDTAKNHVTGVPTYNVPYSDNFEGSVTWVTPGTLWEWGTPSSTVINAAYSPVHAWKTNLDGEYTNSAAEYLYTPYFMFTSVDSAYLEFWHWYDTESGYDGGLVEYSIGGGAWTTLGIQGDANAVNWYNTASPACWSGSSAGYVYSKYRLTAIPAIVNATSHVQFRFKFFSDGGGVGDGWAVDNFAITAPPIPNDAGVVAILQPSAATQTGSPVTVQVKIKNFGTNVLISVPVRYVVNGGAVTAETWTGSLAPLATANYTFTAPYNSPGSTYELCAFTKLSDDNYTFNDSTCASFGTTPAPNDVGVSAILSPGPVTIYGQADTVKVRIKNYGYGPVTSIPVVFTRNLVQVGAGIWNGTLAGGDSVDYTFTTLSISPIGNYTLCAKTTLTGDANTTNDQACMYANGQVGIETYDFSSFVLDQNMPNPAGNNTTILFYVPESGKVRFEMVDILGQIIRTDDIDAVKGKNQINLDAAHMPEGIYFYSAEYKGEKLTKRMVIAK